MLIMLKGTTINDIKYLYDDYPDIYKAIKKEIFDNPNLSKYGFTIIAFPKSETKIPEWLIPLIDIDTIVADNMRNALIFLRSIGLKEINVTKDETFYSNIIDF